VAAAASGITAHAVVPRSLDPRNHTYKLQERPLGGLSKSIIRKLERLNLDSEASDAQKPARPSRLCPGLRHGLALRDMPQHGKRLRHVAAMCWPPGFHRLGARIS
jgi:hypothetical protein